MKRCLTLALALSGLLMGCTSCPPATSCTTDMECETILVGIVCEGPSWVAVAREEDNLPACEEIERHYLQ